MEKLRFNDKSGNPEFDNLARAWNRIATSSTSLWTIPKGKMPRKAKKAYLNHFREFAIRLWILDLIGEKYDE